MSHDLLRNAPDQDMFQSCEAVRRRDDQIDAVIFCEVANVDDRRALGKDRFEFCASEVHCPDKFSHLALGIFTSGLLQPANVVDSRALARIDVSEPCGMEQNEPGSKPIGKPDRVFETSPRATGKIHWNKDCLNREG